MAKAPTPDVNQVAFRRMQGAIHGQYARGHFVAIADGHIVADAGNYSELTARLKSQGLDPSQTLVVRAGDDYPETAIILTVGSTS